MQERQIERLGGRGTIPVDVRIIAATNRDLAQAVAEGRFREDLYYRLKVVTLSLPPLRERKGDIPLLTDYFLERFAAEAKVDIPTLAPEARNLLQAHHWPGNVRELANTLRKALIFHRGAPLERDDMLRALGTAEGPGTTTEQARTDDLLRDWLRAELLAGGRKRPFDELHDPVEELLIREALELTGGNRSRVSRLLGGSRPTLLARMAKYGLREEPGSVL